MGTEDWYEENLELKETEPLNFYFDRFGMGS